MLSTYTARFDDDGAAQFADGTPDPVVTTSAPLPLPPDAVWHNPSAPRYCVPLQPENSPITSFTPAAAICRLPFVFSKLLAGIAAPFTCDTTGLGYDPLRSPDAAPFGGSAVGVFEICE